MLGLLRCWRGGWGGITCNLLVFGLGHKFQVHVLQNLGELLQDGEIVGVIQQSSAEPFGHQTEPDDCQGPSSYVIWGRRICQLPSSLPSAFISRSQWASKHKKLDGGDSRVTKPLGPIAPVQDRYQLGEHHPLSPPPVMELS